MVGIASLKPALREAQSLGRNGDTILAHINPREAAMLKRAGGSGTRNPRTGLLQFDDGEGEGAASPESAAAAEATAATPDSSPAPTPDPSRTDASARQQAERNTPDNVATQAQNDARAQATANAQSEADMRAAQAQGQGANVTDQQPRSPAQVSSDIRFGITPSVENNLAPTISPDFKLSFGLNGFNLTPTNVGIPSLVADAIGPGAFNASKNQDPYGNNFMGSGVPNIDPSKSTWSGSFKATYGTPDEMDAVNKQAAIESGPKYGWGAAYNMGSGAFGKYGLMPDTAIGLLDKYHPDLTIGMTNQQKLDSVLTNQDLQGKLAVDLQREDAKALGRLGLASSDDNMRVEHFLGATDAAKVLSATPDTLVSDALGTRAGRVISANPSLSGMTVGELKSQAANQMAAAGKVSENGITSSGGYGLVAQGETPQVPGNVVTVGSGNPQTPVSASTEAADTKIDTVTAAQTSPETFGQFLDKTFEAFGKIPAGIADAISGVFSSNQGITNPAGYSLGLDNQKGQVMLDQYDPKNNRLEGNSNNNSSSSSDQSRASYGGSTATSNSGSTAASTVTPVAVPDDTVLTGSGNYKNRGTYTGNPLVSGTVRSTSIPLNGPLYSTPTPFNFSMPTPTTQSLQGVATNKDRAIELAGRAGIGVPYQKKDGTWDIIQL